MTRAPAAVAGVEGTIVFTDIVGFTEYTALQGDDEALALLSAQERVVRDVLPQGARIVKELGDGLLLWFPDACQAVESVFTLQRRFEDESAGALLPLWVRVGMHTGRATRRGDDLVGHCVNVAARVVDVAAPGEVLLSDATHAVVCDELDGIEFEEVGPVVMKGIPEPVRLFRAVAA